MPAPQHSLDLSALKDTVCVVTGAGNGGIGYGICEIAGVLGLHLAVLDLFPQVAESAAKRLQVECPAVEVRGYGCDVTRPDTLEAVVEALLRDFPGKRIGAVFANAGVIYPCPGILSAKLKDVRQTMDVNVVGLIATAQTFVPLLQKSTEPSIFCTTASIGGLIFGGRSLPDYCASKHAAVHVTEALGVELATSAPQIRVHVCCPCLVSTGLMLTSASVRTKDATKVEAFDPSTTSSPLMATSGNPEMSGLFLTPRNHGQQVWDRIAAGEFYMICDNIRPYVDHDFPFDGAKQVQRRAELLLQPDFERTVDFKKVSMTVTPLFKEAQRRMQNGGASAKL